MNTVRSVSGHVSLIRYLRPHPFAPSALPGFIATMGASDFPTPHRLPFSLFRLVRELRLHTRAGVGISTVTAHSPFKARLRPVIPGWLPRARRLARHVLPAGVLKPSARYPTLTISGLRPSRQHWPPFHLACFCAYASSALLPVHLQGSIPGPWLTVTRAGFSPARLRALPCRNQDPASSSVMTPFRHSPS